MTAVTADGVVVSIGRVDRRRLARMVADTPPAAACPLLRPGADALHLAGYPQSVPDVPRNGWAPFGPVVSDSPDAPIIATGVGQPGSAVMA